MLCKEKIITLIKNNNYDDAILEFKKEYSLMFMTFLENKNVLLKGNESLTDLINILKNRFDNLKQDMIFFSGIIFDENSTRETMLYELMDNYNYLKQKLT